MNAVEIEAAVSELAAQPFDGAEFPYAFLAAFGNKEDTTLRRLRSGQSNKSDVPSGVLQQNNIHLAVAAAGRVGQALEALRASPKTVASKAKFILATDGRTVEAEDLGSGETIVSPYPELAEHFGFFLPLAGISTTKEIKDSPIDVRATGRLNKLYIEILKTNPEWAKDSRQHDLNRFLTRLIFCFFAEDTSIFPDGLFSKTIAQMSERDGSNTHEVLETAFHTMNFPITARAGAKFPTWATPFPYVNGGLFGGNTAVPRISKMALTYLQHAGALNWKEINPDIFGSMIQAVANDDERGELGMHYTSVPNILKVLNPLFLDALRAELEAAGTSAQKLLNLRNRISKIQVFDPACGSGNFLVIAYKHLRAIEAEINERRKEKGEQTAISITNFRGIEIRSLAAEIARLSLTIAEYQCDVAYRGPKLALDEVLPLEADNWISCDNALRVDWLNICPPQQDGETFICGNPPYLGSTWQSGEQKADLRGLFEERTRNWKSLDYVAGWFIKAADYGAKANASAAFVSTNSICQGQQVPILWPLVFATGHEIAFAHTSFKWANLAKHNAGVMVVVIGISRGAGKARRLFSTAADGQVVSKETDHINAYLVAGRNVIVEKASRPAPDMAEMDFGSKPTDGGHLLLNAQDLKELKLTAAQRTKFVRRIYGSVELIHNALRYCLWIADENLAEALKIPAIKTRLEGVRKMRTESPKAATQVLAAVPHRFGEVRQAGGEKAVLIVPSVSSESRQYLPVGLAGKGTVVSNLAFALFDAPLWNMALIASRLHLVWIGAVCGKMKTDFRYSNTMGWNTFQIPLLTEQNKVDLTRCGENILLARETHFPATIAELYDPETMPPNLRRAHEENDEVLERIYIGRRFKNDTERLEKLFDLYSKSATVQMDLESSSKPRAKKKSGKVAT
jgi:hypothetical protein